MNNMLQESSQTADIAIVGGGVIGLSIARAVARRGVKDVVVIERGSFGCEASSAAAGMLAPQAEADTADTFFELCCRSRDLYPGFALALREETGIDVELDQTGTLYLALTEADDRELSHRYDWQQAAGLAVERLNAEDALRLEPSISSKVRGALRFPRDFQVENRRLVSALAESDERLGVKLLAGTSANSVVTAGNSIAGIETSRGFLSTRNLVLAAGAWTSLLPRPDKADSNISIEPVRGQMVCFETNPRLAKHVIYSPRGYLVPRFDGRLLAGSTSEEVGFDKRTTGDGIHSILTRAFEISDKLRALSLTDTWAGLRPRAPDGLPVLGPCAEIEGLFYASGHYRNGILLAPITGELMAEAIVTKELSPLIKGFGPDRFRLNHVLAS
jgi:glycine oxidase